MSAALTPPERATLAAVLDRLMPADEHGPGAVEAGVADFVELGLAGPLADLRGAYARGLGGIDAVATSTHGSAFADLEPAAQDAVLSSVESSPHPELQAFFELVRIHAIHGMFSDPVHGGNRAYAGWDLLGFPGAKGVFSEADQRLDAAVAWTRDG